MPSDIITNPESPQCLQQQEGIAWTELNADQQAGLRLLIEEYIGNLEAGLRESYEHKLEQGADHVQTIWREQGNDFGEDLLRRHYETAGHHASLKDFATRYAAAWSRRDPQQLAAFVPPPPHLVAACMSDLERFLRDEDDRTPVVIRAGLAHVQFETVHPLLDGNGRIGRLLVTFLLSQAGVLREPLMYLSLYLKQNRDEYYRLLDRVREEGDWESWVVFFLDGVQRSAEGAVSTAQRLADLLQEDRKRIQEKGRVAGSALRVHDVLKERSVISLQEVTRRAALSFPAAASGMALLEDLGVAKELTGKKHNRVFGYSRYLAILSEGTETF